MRQRNVLTRIITFGVFALIVLVCLTTKSIFANNCRGCSTGVVEVLGERAVLRSGSGEDFDRITTLPVGSRFTVLEQAGEWVRIKLSSVYSGWVKNDILKKISGKEPSSPLLFGAKIKVINGSETVIRAFLNEPGAVIARQWLNPPVLFLDIHGARGQLHEINFDPDDKIVKHLSVTQSAPDLLTLKIDLDSWQLTGYSCKFQGNLLEIRLRKGKINGESMKGFVVAIDPGHGGKDSGAIGAGGYKEKEANLAIAFILKKLLEEAGAKVFMTREDDMELTDKVVIESNNNGNAKSKNGAVAELAARVSFAKEKGAHLFVSIHCNAKGIVSEGRAAKGSYIYYYHPGSFPFATVLAKELAEQIGEDTFGVNFRSFHVTRENPLMPAVLAEVAFISNPDEEEKLKTFEFKKLIAEGLFNGIIKYLKQ